MRKLFLLGACLSMACGPPVPQPSSGAVDPPSVTFEPSADPAQVSSVTHVHVASTSLSSGSVSLFQGQLSSYYLGKLEPGELPDALVARRVPLLSFRSETELVAAALAPLALGPYSLVSPAGLLSEFQVSSALPFLHRIWPPSASAGALSFAVYCADEPNSADLPSLPQESLSFEPRGVTVALSPGVDDDGSFSERCVHFGSDAALEPGELLLPPPLAGAWALDPSLFGAADLEPVVPLVCEAGEVALGPGCAAVADDRAVVRTPAAALLWVVHTEAGSLVVVTRAGAPLTIRGLTPGSREHLWGSTRDASGGVLGLDVRVSTAPARARPILNEALADALGPEPQSEWIELFNDGTLAADLGQYSLQDNGGLTPLPDASLAPREYALLVRDDFAPNPSDQPPAPGARLIRMPQLGKSGLSNSGERLALVAADGVECSVMPALSGKPGQSLARRTPESPDADPKSFSFGTPTPGFSNQAPAGNAN